MSHRPPGSSQGGRAPALHRDRRAAGRVPGRPQHVRVLHRRAALPVRGVTGHWVITALLALSSRISSSGMVYWTSDRIMEFRLHAYSHILSYFSSFCEMTAPQIVLFFVHFFFGMPNKVFRTADLSFRVEHIFCH